MRRRHSLVRRLVSRFAAVTLLGATVTTLAYALLEEIELEYELQDLAGDIARDIRPARDGDGPAPVRLEAHFDEHLLAHIAALNALHLRVHDTATGGVVFARDHAIGDPDSVEAIRDRPPGVFTLGHPASPGHEFGFIEELPTPAGVPVRIVARRGPPELRDYAYWMTTGFTLELGPMLFMVAVVGTTLAIVTVRNGLAPLARVSAQAAKIEPGSSVRLETREVPEELLPPVEAVNRLLDRLQDALARQRSFTALAAHELGTPLAALRARIDALPADLSDRRQLAASLDRTTRLVDQLLAVARLESGQIAPDENLDLREVAETVAAEMAPVAGASDRDLVLELPDREVPVRGHRDALGRAVADLVHDAFRHTPAGTPVEIRVTTGGVIAVLDRGPGLGGRAPAELFRPFTRGRTTRGAADGAGLGLAIVHDVARLHGGRVDAHDRPEGGAVFTIELPLRRTRAFASFPQGSRRVSARSVLHGRGVPNTPSTEDDPMNTKIAALAVFTAFGLSALPAMAGPSCTGRGEKLPEQKVQQMYVEKGCEIRKWKISSGGCYEIYGMQNGRKVEVYIDPWTGEELEQHVESRDGGHGGRCPPRPSRRACFRSAEGARRWRPHGRPRPTALPSGSGIRSCACSTGRW